MKKRLLIFLCAAAFLGGCGSVGSGNKTSAAAIPETTAALTSAEAASESPTAGLTSASAKEQSAAAETGTKKDSSVNSADDFGWESVPLSISDIRFTIPDKARKTVPKLKPDQFPKEDGSTATLPLSKALYQISTGATTDEADRAIAHTKTTSSYYNLLNGSNDLVIAYEPSDKFYEDLKKSSVKLNIQPIGKDALVFLMNEGNPVHSLTDSQLRDIYSGKISNWSALGGTDQEIIAFQRPENSGSQNLMEKLVMKDTPMAKAPESWVEGEMGDLIDSVASYNNSRNALGYSVYFYARNMYEQPGLGFMKVNGISPDNDTIRSGSYPYVNEFYAAIRADAPEDSAQYRLFSWLTGDEGQSLIESLGYVSVRKTDIAENTLQTEEFKGRLQLPAGKALAISGETVLDTPGTLLLSDSAENMTFLKNYVIDSCYKEQSIVSLSEPQIVEKKAKDGWDTGLRDMANGKWLIEPHYREIIRHTNGIFEAVFLNPSSGGEMQDLYDSSGKKIAATAAGENAVVGSGYIWICDDEKRTVRVLDLSGKQTRTVSLSPESDYFFMEPDDSGFMKVNATGRSDDAGNFLYRENGELAFDVSMVPDSILVSLGIDRAHLTVGSFLDGGNLAVILVTGTQSDSPRREYLYDIAKKKLLTNGEEISAAKKSCLVKPSAGEPYVIGKTGEQMLCASGKPFNNQVPGTEALVRQETDTVWFSDPDHAREYVLHGDFGDSPYIDYEPASNLIMISNYSESNETGYAFHGGDLLLGGKSVNAGSGESGPYARDGNTDEFIHAQYDSPYYFDQKDGVERCTMEDGAVHIQTVGNTYTVTDRNDTPVVKMYVSYY